MSKVNAGLLYFMLWLGTMPCVCLLRYMCGYYCDSNDYCSGADADSLWQTTGRYCTEPLPDNATQGVFAVYTGSNTLKIGEPSTQPLRPTIFNFIGSITLPTTVRGLLALALVMVM